MANLTVVNARDLAKSESIQNKFKDILGDNHKYFIQSVVNSVSMNNKLLQCDGKSVWGAAMNAAVLGLPVDSNLGYSAIIPYGIKAQFQIMTKGYIQLAIDSGLYKNIHVADIYEDEILYYDYLRGKAYFTEQTEWKQREAGETKKIVGYYACFELLNGFYKELFMSKPDVLIHAKTYSKSINFKDSVWKTNPDAMGRKTVLKNLLRSYGKLGKGSMLSKALEVDQGFVEDLDTEDPKYYDNPSVEGDYIEGEVIEATDFDENNLDDEFKS
jgi:recombination protein RecT